MISADWFVICVSPFFLYSTARSPEKGLISCSDGSCNLLAGDRHPVTHGQLRSLSRDTPHSMATESHRQAGRPYNAKNILADVGTSRSVKG